MIVRIVGFCCARELQRIDRDFVAEKRLRVIYSSTVFAVFRASGVRRLRCLRVLVIEDVMRSSTGIKNLSVSLLADVHERMHESDDSIVGIIGGNSGIRICGVEARWLGWFQFEDSDLVPLFDAESCACC